MLEEDDKTYYDELLKEDSEEHALFMAHVEHGAEDILLARQMLHGARRLSNHRARPHHQRACPESAETEPPVEFHHMAAQELSQSSTHDHSSAEPRVRFSQEVLEAADEDMVNTSSSEDGSESDSDLSSMSGMRESDDPAHRPSVRPTGNHFSNGHEPGSESASIRHQPWAYSSMYLLARSARGLGVYDDTALHATDMARDQEVSFEDFQLGSRKLIEDLVSLPETVTAVHAHLIYAEHPTALAWAAVPQIL